MSHEEDRLVDALKAAWTFEGRPLRHFVDGEAEWPFINFAPDDSSGPFKSGPDRVFQDGINTLVVVEAKVARTPRPSRLGMARQAHGYALQARRLLGSPDRRVSVASRGSSRTSFQTLCNASGFTPSTKHRIVVVLMTLVPEVDQVNDAKVHEFLTQRLVGPDFADRLRGGPMTQWREAILAESTPDLGGLDWAVVENVGTAANRIDLRPHPDVSTWC